jgi:GxxExxY protein
MEDIERDMEGVEKWIGFCKLARAMAVQRDPVVGSILRAAIEVHRSLGPGLFESVYRDCLVRELEQADLRVAQEVVLPVFYRGASIDRGFRLDLVVEDHVVVEIKSVKSLLPVHSAQILTYLKLSGLKRGLLLNFNVVRLKYGVKSFLN